MPNDWIPNFRDAGTVNQDDPLSGFRIPSGSDVTPQQTDSALRLMLELRKQQQESRAAAIRYQGQQEYQQLLQQGVAPVEALRQAAPKMFYEHPSGITAATKYMQPRPKNYVPPEVIDIGGSKYWRDPNTRTGWKPVPVGRTLQQRPVNPKSTPEWSQYETKIRAAQQRYNSVMRQIDGFAGHAPANLSRQARLLQETIEKLQDEQMTFAKSMPSTQGAPAGQMPLGAGVPPPVAPGQPQPMPPSPAGAVPTAGTGVAKGLPEGAMVRNKKTGEMARIVNGVPVPIRGGEPTAGPAVMEGPGGGVQAPPMDDEEEEDQEQEE